jgi:hypothetical protein
MTRQRAASPVVLLTLGTALLTNACTAPGGVPRAATATTADEAAILQVISEHYVAAVFQNRDAASVRRGFHPDFHLFVLDDGEIIVAPLELWLERLGLDGQPSTSRIGHEVVFVDVTGDAAVLRTELFVDGEHVYTDYFSLYRFPSDGWRIVTKIFQSHD